MEPQLIDGRLLHAPDDSRRLPATALKTSDRPPGISVSSVAKGPTPTTTTVMANRKPMGFVPNPLQELQCRLVTSESDRFCPPLEKYLLLPFRQ